jgi:glutathione peroxidase
MFAKIEVNGAGACPLYKYLTSKENNPKFAGSIKWNFNKFLLDREGNVIARFEPRVRPDSPEVIGAIEKALAKK